MSQIAMIKDVAQRAGCGVATVSRVLKNTCPANAKMRECVLATIETILRVLGAGAGKTILPMIDGSDPPDASLEKQRFRFRALAVDYPKVEKAQAGFGER